MSHSCRASCVDNASLAQRPADRRQGQSRTLGNGKPVDRRNYPFGHEIATLDPFADESQRIVRDVHAAVREQQPDDRAEKSVVRLLDAGRRSDGQASSKIRQCNLPKRRYIVHNHDNWATAVLRGVPGVEQLFLVMALSIIEQAPADTGNESTGKQRSARPPWTGQHRRFDRPTAPTATKV